MKYLTVKETAQMLRVSPITVRRYIASGELAAERVGRSIRIRREAIEEFVEPVMPEGKPTSKDDPLWGIVGIGESSEPTNITDHKDKYIADAIAASWEFAGIEDSGESPEFDLDGDEAPTFLEILGISVGIGRSGEPTNIAEYKDEYLADAFEQKG